jgi:hypothetical protein
MEDIKSLKINGQEVPLVKPAEVIVTIKNKKLVKFTRMKKL